MIHSFPGTPGNTDGQNPVGALAIDSAGNLWGSTPTGGSESDGTVFELTPKSDGTFTESLLYSFTGQSTGFNPFTNLVIDIAGNLYGTAENGGLGAGVVFRIAPQPGGGVQETVIHAFAPCGATICADGLNSIRRTRHRCQRQPLRRRRIRRRCKRQAKRGMRGWPAY